MKYYAITIELPDDTDAQGVAETVQEHMGELIEEQGGSIVSVEPVQRPAE